MPLITVRQALGAMPGSWFEWRLSVTAYSDWSPGQCPHHCWLCRHPSSVILLLDLVLPLLPELRCGAPPWLCPGGPLLQEACAEAEQPV